MLVGVFMTSLCTEYYQFFLAQALLLGSSMSFPLCAAVSTVSRHFHRNKGLAMGITIAGSSLGGVIWPIAINELLNRDGVSFGWTIRIVGFIMLPLLLLAVLTIDLPSEDKERRGHSDQGNQVQQRRGPVIALVTNTTFLLLCAGLATCYLGMFSPFFYITSYAESIGHPVSFAFYLVSIVNAASLFGRILPGFLADRYGHFEICSLAALLSGIIAFCWTPVKSTAALVVWALAYGFASGVSASLCKIVLLTKLGYYEFANCVRCHPGHAGDTGNCARTGDGITCVKVSILRVLLHPLISAVLFSARRLVASWSGLMDTSPCPCTPVRRLWPGHS